MKRSLLFVILSLAAITASANSTEQNELPTKSRSAQSDLGPDSTVADVPRQHADDSLNQASSSNDYCAAYLGGDGSDDASGFDVLF